MPQVQIIDEIVQSPVKKEVHPRMTQNEKFSDCPVEVPQVKIINEIVQAPVEKEVQKKSVVSVL